MTTITHGRMQQRAHGFFISVDNIAEEIQQYNVLRMVCDQIVPT
jgi:hypothetical protein